MSTLLTHEEYISIAKNITYSVDPFVNGKFYKPLAGKTMETINPATGEVLATVAACDSADVDAAVIIAQQAFDEGKWSRLHPNERKKIIIRPTSVTRKSLPRHRVPPKIEAH